MMDRRRFLGGTAGCLSGAAGLVSPALVRAQTVQLRAGSDLIRTAQLGGDVGYLVADLRSGLVLEEHNARKALPPASTAKAITSLYALEALGAGYRFVTRVIATGPISGGVLQGDLILAGGADATLSTDDLGAMAARLAATGLRRITGRFQVWGGAIPYAEEIATDQPIHVGYNPAISGMILNYNRVHFEWRRAGNGYELGMDARGESHRPRAYTASAALANRRDPLFTYRQQGGKEQWTVAAARLGKGGSRWLPVRQPELYAGDVFQTLARAQGVDLPAPQPVRNLAGGTVLVSHASEALPGILRDMMKYSTNLTAEAVGMTASAARGANPALGRSGAAMSDWLAARAGIRGAKFVDHSGLNVQTRVSAADMVHALRVVGAPMGLRGLMKGFSLRDDQGRTIKNHPIRVDAKTGTLNFVSTLAGYLTARDGTELVFAIFTGDVARRARAKNAEAPEGAGEWVKRSKILQSRLVERWGLLYG